MDNITISVKSNISMLILDNVPSDAGFISLVFDKFSDEAINIDMISQTPPRGKYTSIAFTFDDSELTKALGCLSHIKEECPSLSSSVSSSNSKITVMSEDMRSGYGFASKVFSAVSRASGDVRLITTSETEISILVPDLDEKQCLSEITECFNKN